MPAPNLWTQIPTTLLDAGQRQSDAKAWGDAQRAKLAQSWGDVQRQALATAVDTWQKGTAAVDGFAAGFSGNGPQDAQQGATGPSGGADGSQQGAPGYNDMGGASSGPPSAGLSSTFGQPPGPQDLGPTAPPPEAYNDMAGASSSGDQGAAAAASNPSLPGMGGLSPNQSTPPSSLPDVVARGASAANDYLADQQAQGRAAWTADPSGHVTPAQVQAMGERFATGLNVATPGGPAVGEAAQAAGPAAASVAGDAARAGNILLNKYVSPEVRQVIADAAARAPEAMTAATRGVVTDDQVAQLADAAGTSIQRIVDRWKPGQAANAETVTALRTALATKADQVAQAAQTVNTQNTPANLLNLQVALREHQAIQEAVTGVTAEAGRTLRTLRSQVSAAQASNDPSAMQTLLQKMGGVKWTEDLATKLGQLDPNDAIGRYQFLRDAMKPQLKDYLTELWYNAMLSAPRTHLVKSMSETTSLLLSPIERVAAAAVDAPLALVQGRARQRFAGEALPDLFGMVQGIPEGIQKALFTIQHGYSMSEVLGPTDYIRAAAFRGPVGAVVNFPSRTMAAAAEFSAAIGESGALNAGAYRIARMEGLAGDQLTQRIAELRQNPTPALLKYAQTQGQYRVYQSPPGKFVQAIAGVRDATPVGIGRVLLPFLQTPANLLKFGLERSPLGALNPSIYKNLANKAPGALDTTAADQIGRWAMGSLMATAIGIYALKGDITGPPPTSPGERDAWTRTGKQPYSIRVGDHWADYRKLEPINETFSQVASLVDALKQGKDVSSTVGQVVATIGTNLVSQTYMASLSAAINAVQDPARYGGRLIDSLAGSTVPALSRTIAQNVDPTMRQAQGPIEAMQAEIPGLSQNLPPKLNAFGEPVLRDTSNISPVAVSQALTSPLEQELARYKVEPGLTGKTLQGMDLTRAESADYQRLSGQLVKQALSGLVADPGYTQLNDLNRAKALQVAISRAKNAAAHQYVSQLLDRYGQDTIIQRIQQKKLARLPKAG